jgi:hypothetical protein
VNIVVTTKKWRLIVTPLSGSTPLHQLEVEASNWIGALRAARKELGEEGGIPPGASNSVESDGTVTILDSASRRRFLLTPTSGSLPPTSAPPVQQPIAASEAAAAVAPVAAAPKTPEPAEAPRAEAAPAKKRKFQTVAYMPGMDVPALAPAAPPSTATATPSVDAAPVVEAAPEAPSNVAPQKKFDTVGFATDIPVEHRVEAPAAVAETPAVKEVRARSATPMATAAADPAPPLAALELLLTRNEEPTPQNPLTYRERAYLIAKGMSVTEAEAALRFTLAELKAEVSAAPRGKFVNLAAFDHRWTEQPERPPLIVLEWRDWRGEPLVDYPAAERSTSLMPTEADSDTDERIALVFESLHELAHLKNAAQALDFAVQLLGTAVPAVAMSACLYDINTDELRFVAVTGPGAELRQGKATPRSAGLFGVAGRVEHAAVVIPDARVHPQFNPASDGREGLEVESMMLRPIVDEGQLLGMLQLINRRGGAFSAGDVHVVNYIGDRLGEFLRQVRVRVHA